MRLPTDASRRLTIAAALAAAATAPRPAQAWCGAAFPSYAYQLPWFEFPVGGAADKAAMRVVGAAAAEKAKNLSPLLVLAPPGLTYEYLETLEALTISERRVAFLTFSSAAASQPLLVDEEAKAALAALEAPRVHVLGHGTAARAALALQANQPSAVQSLILASPLVSADDAVEGARNSLPAALLASSTGSAPRACVDAESTLQAAPSRISNPASSASNCLLTHAFDHPIPHSILGLDSFDFFDSRHQSRPI